MGAGKPFIFFISVAVIIHAIVLGSFYPYIKASGEPVIYCWPSIIREKDLLASSDEIVLPRGVPFSLDYLDKRYFFNPLSALKPGYTPVSAKAYHVSKIEDKSKQEEEYIYLWQVPKFSFSGRKEKVSFKALVSDKGKVILSFPEQLPVDSSDNIMFQDHMRESIFSPGDKFFWTKLEGVLQ